METYRQSYITDIKMTYRHVYSTGIKETYRYGHNTSIKETYRQSYSKYIKEAYRQSYYTQSVMFVLLWEKPDRGSVLLFVHPWLPAGLGLASSIIFILYLGRFGSCSAHGHCPSKSNGVQLVGERKHNAGPMICWKVFDPPVIDPQFTFGVRNCFDSQWKQASRWI